VVANGLALCALHHALFDLGVLGLTAELRIRVSSLNLTRSYAGRRAVDDLSGQPLLALRPGQPVVELVHVDWHPRRVFKGSTSRPYKSRIRFRYKSTLGRRVVDIMPDAGE
jgi:putative restriction endonuclease